ncbi:MAG TPA: NADPH:quinone reductase [Alphaproteobacteria bacterium]
MKACWYERTGPAREVLQFGEMPTPEPGPGEVRVKVMVSAVNPSDTKARSGWRGRPMAYPRIIPHQDGSGVIDKLGPGVAGRRVGERVWLYMAQRGRPFGSLAEYTTVPQERAVRLPDPVSFEEGACLAIPAMTAHRALYADGEFAGQNVLVQGGAGAVGFYAVQLAKLGRARTVIATVSRDAQAAQAKKAGADHVINYRSEPVAERIAQVTGAALSIDRIVEVALGANIDTDVEVLRPNGVISAYSSDAVADPKLPFAQMLAKDLTLHTLIVYEIPQAARDAAAHDINRALDERKLIHQIAEVFPFEKAAAAHDRMEAGRDIGKLLIRVG